MSRKPGRKSKAKEARVVIQVSKTRPEDIMSAGVIGSVYGALYKSKCDFLDEDDGELGERLPAAKAKEAVKVGKAVAKEMELKAKFRIEDPNDDDDSDDDYDDDDDDDSDYDDSDDD